MRRKKLPVIIIISVLILLSLNVFQKEVRNFFYLTSSPFQKILWQAGEKTSNFFEALSKIHSLREEVERLRHLNQELLQKLITFEKIKKENEFLREALNAPLRKNFKLLLASTIEKDIGQDSILIDKGSDDGVEKDMPVITSQKALVGKVEKVYKHFSKVNLISNKGTSFPVIIMSEGEEKEEREVKGIAKGKGNFTLYIDFLLADKEIFPGDIVATCALGGVFPEDLLLGRIEKIKKSDVEPFQQAKVELAFNIKTLKELFIITEY